MKTRSGLVAANLLQQATSSKLYLKCRQFHTINPDFIKVSPKVAAFVDIKRPVIALESTILTHGLPPGVNLETATRLEKQCNDAGVLAATIGIIDGFLKVGLGEEELKYLCSGNQKLVKLSRRDLPSAFANSQSGGSTVSSTLIGCHAASIPVFATGGLGGVHRNVEKFWDISADLEELAKTPVAVVCSGVKSILDVPKTLEYLETKGVGVISYQSEFFPTFFSNSKTIKSPNVCNRLTDLVKMLLFIRRSGLKNGLVIANPAPEKFLVDGNEIEDAIQQAIRLAEIEEVSGRNITPFVLEKVRQITGNKSLKANLALVENNVKLGCKLAIGFQKYLLGSDKDRRSCQTVRNEGPKKYPLIIGAINVDITIKPKGEPCQASVDSEISLSFGGVGRNITEGLHFLEAEPKLISSIGSDALGKFVLGNLNFPTDNVAISNKNPTSIYALLMNSTATEMKFGYAQSDIHSEIDPKRILDKQTLLENASVVIHDGNISTETSRTIMSACKSMNIPLLFEPTDYVECGSYASSMLDFPNVCQFVTPNLKELFVLNESIKNAKSKSASKLDADKAVSLDESTTLSNCLEIVEQNSDNVLDVTKIALVSLGSLGVIAASSDFSSNDAAQLQDKCSRKLITETGQFYLFEAEEPEKVASCSGAGDSFVAGFVSDYFQEQRPLCESIQFGLRCAQTSLKVVDAINPAIAHVKA